MNWATDNTSRALTHEAKKVLKKEKQRRKDNAKKHGKKLRLVKVCDKPLTYKEIED